MGAHLSSRTERLSIIEQMLFRSPAGLRAVEIADACGVDRRTAYRDLDVLRDTGVPVYQKNGRFYINRDYYLATLRLNLNEVVMLFVALRVLAYQQDHQNPHLIAVLKKLADIVPALPSKHTLSVAEQLWSAPVDRAYISVLETLIRGWWDRRAVKLWAGRGSVEFTTYFIEPSPSGDLFVVGQDLGMQRVRVLKVRRIKRAVLLKMPSYEIPPDFNRHRYLNAAWVFTEPEDISSDAHLQELRLVFSADAAAAFKSRLGLRPSQIERLDDGRYLMRVQVADWRELLPWIRSWGAQVEVLSPVSLREHLADDAARMLAYYRNAETS